MNKSQKSLLKRFESIIHDAEYVRQCAQHLDLPIIANQRCGSWYVPPDLLALSCYFKSTDGHVNKWAFNHRRLNLYLLPLIEGRKGCIIVDSTRGSKQISDALSKTIPIWCAVLNRLLFPDHPEPQSLVLPTPEIVPVLEKTAIEQALPSLYEDACRLNLDLTALRQQVTRPLRPHFLQPPTHSPQTLIDSQDVAVHNIVLLMASHNNLKPPQPPDEAQFPFPGYIRGAGDDEDNWCRELTPAIFWQNKEKILGTLVDSEVDYDSVIQQMRLEQALEHGDPVPIGPPGLFIGITSLHLQQHLLTNYDPFHAIIACDAPPSLDLTVTALANEGKRTPLLRLNLPSGKIGSRQLRTAFPKVVTFLLTLQRPKPAILVTDKEGKDHAVAISLLISCLFFTEGEFTPVPSNPDWTKENIRRHLAVMTSCLPDISPSRASLQSLHAFLMPRDGAEASKRAEKTSLLVE